MPRKYTDVELSDVANPAGWKWCENTAICVISSDGFEGLHLKATVEPHTSGGVTTLDLFIALNGRTGIPVDGETEVFGWSRERMHVGSLTKENFGSLSTNLPEWLFNALLRDEITGQTRGDILKQAFGNLIERDVPAKQKMMAYASQVAPQVTFRLMNTAASEKTVLVWERSDIPELLYDVLSSIGLSEDLERVALLPLGETSPDARYYFMGASNFAPSGTACLLESGQTLWLGGKDAYVFERDEDEEEMLPPVIRWNPRAEDTERVILVWRFENTPQDWYGLAHQGGDEDWVAYVPDGVEPPYWLDEGNSFGCCSVNQEAVEEGTLFVGCHA